MDAIMMSTIAKTKQLKEALALHTRPCDRVKATTSFGVDCLEVRFNLPEGTMVMILAVYSAGFFDIMASGTLLNNFWVYLDTVERVKQFALHAGLKTRGDHDAAQQVSGSNP